MSRGLALGVLFDLDGVLVSTDELHFRAWSELASEYGIPFTRADNDRLRGVSRMESLERLLERAPRAFDGAEKRAMAERKNTRYRELLQRLVPGDAMPGGRELLASLRQRGVATAIASSSRNARDIASRIGLDALVDTIVDGNDITRSKPDPEVFLVAARRLGLEPRQCVVVEDAESGIEAARQGGFRVVAVGSSAGMAGLGAATLADLPIEQLLGA